MTTATELATRDLTGTWAIDAVHSSLGFSTKHMVITKVTGSFQKFEGSFSIGSEPSEMSATASIDAASIFTGSQDRDAHLKSSDFLDVETFPTLAFAATSVELLSDKTGRVTGDLTIKDVTRPVTLDVELEGITTDAFTGASRVAFTATGSFDREEFGLTYNKVLETGGVLVGKEIKLTLDIGAVKQ